ncbi:MAG: hypothetical protein JWN25_2324 [Verrucomicrobiales bacterium]|nr:hypothetical protein [Verrucomicrobiales bacterium]
MTEIERARLETISRQLDRMRTVQNQYQSRLYHCLIGTTVAALVCMGLHSAVTFLVLPFLLVTGAVLCCYTLNVIEFARLHARALEGKINRLFGERLLIQHEIEGEYFYAFDVPRFSEISMACRPRFFCVFLLHFGLFWGLLLVLDWYNLFSLYGKEQFIWFYSFLFVIWAGLHFVYLWRYFTECRGEQKVTELLRQTYGLERS